MTTLNDCVKARIETKKVILFGKKVGELYDPKSYRQEFATYLSSIKRTGNLGIKNNLDQRKVMEKVLESVDKNLADAFKTEMEEQGKKYQAEIDNQKKIIEQNRVMAEKEINAVKLMNEQQKKDHDEALKRLDEQHKQALASIQPQVIHIHHDDDDNGCSIFWENII